MAYMRSLIIVAVVAVAFSLFGCRGREAGSDAPRLASAGQERDSVVVMLIGVDSMTVFDLLKSLHAIDYQSTAAGVFVKSIDSVYGGSEAYWIYSVNDTLAQVAADKYVTRRGDVIRWHLRKSK